MKPQKQVSDIPNAADRHLWQIQPLRDLTWLVLLVLLLWLGYAMRSVTVPLLVALLLAYLFEPLIAWMERWLRCPRVVAVGSVLAVGGLTVLLVLAITIPLAVGQTVSFVDAVRKGRFDNALAYVVQWVPDSVQPEVEQFIDRGERWLGVTDARADDVLETADPAEQSTVSVAEDDRIRAIVREELAAAHAIPVNGQPTGVAAGSVNWFGVLGNSLKGVWNFILGAIQLGLLAFLIPFYFFAFSVSWPRVTAFGGGLIMEVHRDRTLFLVREMDKAVSGFVRGRIVICVILSTCYAIGWTIVGVPYAIPLGLIAGVFTLVPYLGGLGFVLAAGLLGAEQFSLAEAERMAWWGVLLWPGLVFIFCQLLDDYGLTPFIAGKATNLDPVTIIVAILAGGALAGLYGMLIAIPVAACVKIFLREVLMPRIRAWIEGSVDDPLPIDE